MGIDCLSSLPSCLDISRCSTQNSRGLIAERNAEPEEPTNGEAEVLAEEVATGGQAQQDKVIGARPLSTVRMLKMQMAEAPEDGSNGATREVGKVIGDQVEWVRASASPGKLLRAGAVGVEHRWSSKKPLF